MWNLRWHRSSISKQGFFTSVSATCTFDEGSHWNAALVAHFLFEVNYQIEYLESVVTLDIPRLSKADRLRVKHAIESKLSAHPIEFGKPLRYSLKGARRLRVGNYRVIYTIEPNDVILIVKIGHRQEVYER